jgi:hypothetical protein
MLSAPKSGAQCATKSAMRWPPERQTELERLVAEGLSATLISERLGITRNSIIGRCRRAGLRLKAEVTKPHRNTVKTHCVHGHAFDEKNTYWYSITGGTKRRACRTCRDARLKRWKINAALAKEKGEE